MPSHYNDNQIKEDTGNRILLMTKEHLVQELSLIFVNSFHLQYSWGCQTWWMFRYRDIKYQSRDDMLKHIFTIEKEKECINNQLTITKKTCVNGHLWTVYRNYIIIMELDWNNGICKGSTQLTVNRDRLEIIRNDSYFTSNFTY